MIFQKNKVMRGSLFPSCFFIFSFFSFLPTVPAQENRWYEPFFIEGSGIQYFIPELFSGLIKPEPGVRGALGYEYRNFRFAFESGYTHIEGTNPFVLDLKFFPLTLKTGYNLPIYWGFGLQADLSCGILFSQTAHYNDVIDIFQENKNDSTAAAFLAGARLYATYTFPFEWLKLYAGGGIDAVFETDGVIPLPVIEAGISVKPFALIRPKARKTESAETKVEEPEILQTEVPAAKTPERIVLAQRAVYFRADSTALVEEYRPVLDEVGQRLRANPALRITLKGYTAPTGTDEGMTALSAARSWYCVEYLMRVYGIAENRMNIEFYGADDPEELKSWEYRRRVDIFIEQKAEL
jgi:outer membrane protein OmpA-like peptidoglycan-associated protein